MTVPLQPKLDVLWSFIRSNAKAKTVVFMSSGKQVRVVYEAFRHLQPGILLMHLHDNRSKAVDSTSRPNFRRPSTPISSPPTLPRATLDYPAVDWVIQLDCPEDAGLQL